MSSIAASNSLFEIDAELDDLMDDIQEEIATNGEASPDRIERFQEFCKAHGEKVDRIGRFIRTMDARTQYCRGEAQRLSERARSAENKALRTKAMVLYYLKSRNLKRIEGMECTLRLCANTQDSVLIRDEEQIPLEYKTVGLAMNGHLWQTILKAVPDDLRQTLKATVRESYPNNEAIKRAAALKVEVPGAEVKRGEHLRVA